MLIALKGIVFKTIKYAESSLICKIYTENFGVRSYMVNGVRRPKSRLHAAALQPLSILDMVVYEQANKNLQRIKDIKMAYIFEQIPFDMAKTGIALLVAEIMNKTLQEETPNTGLFNFLEQQIRFLDHSTAPETAHFPLNFLLQLSRHIGFYPHNNYDAVQRPYFHLQEGLFSSQAAAHAALLIEPPLSDVFSQWLAQPQKPLPNKSSRAALLEQMLHYYRLHIENFGELHSYQVLRNLWNT